MRAEAVIAELRALESLRPVLDAVTALSGPYDGVYLVGGTVRDLLLGERSFDVDIAVEGDAIALADGARAGARRAGCVRTGSSAPPPSSTASTAASTSSRPAPSPTMRPRRCRRSSTPEIDDDLFRRDFTINAMAVSLRRDDLGRLVDPFGGRADLEAKRIRVLHPRSFIDDPTRIFRAVRYENRLGFRMDDETVRLAHDSVETGHVGDLSRPRLREELIALFGEGHVDHTIVRIAELGLDEAIHPHLAADTETVELLDRLTELDDGVRARGAFVAARVRRPGATAAVRGGARLAPQPEASPQGR